jgi:hypothetical protein
MILAERDHSQKKGRRLAHLVYAHEDPAKGSFIIRFVQARFHARDLSAYKCVCAQERNYIRADYYIKVQIVIFLEIITYTR